MSREGNISDQQLSSSDAFSPKTPLEGSPKRSPRVSEGGMDPVVPRNPAGKHALHRAWTLWFDNPGKKQNMGEYGKTLQAVYTVDTVEDFWCLINNVKPPSQLPASTAYYFFQDGIEPKWEDPKNLPGGCWTANVTRGPGAKDLVDKWWMESILNCVGEQFEFGDESHGISVNIRKSQDRVEFWTGRAGEEHIQMSLGKEFKRLLGPTVRTIGYGVFEEKIKSHDGKSPDKYTVN